MQNEIHTGKHTPLETNNNNVQQKNKNPLFPAFDF